MRDRHYQVWTQEHNQLFRLCKIPESVKQRVALKLTRDAHYSDREGKIINYNHDQGNL